MITRLNVGGPATHAMLLSSRLRPLGYETCLLAGRPGPFEGDMEDLRPVNGSMTRTLSSLGREISVVGDIRTLWSLVRVFRSFQPQIVHTHLSKAGALGRIAARLARTPVVVHTFHGNVLSGYFNPLRSGTFLRVERALARITDRVVALSARQAAEIVGRGIAEDERVVVIPLGLDLRPFMEAVPGSLRAQLKVGPDVPIVATIARLVPIKGIDVFLGAAQRILASGHRAIFVIAGDGEERARLQRSVAERGMSGAVKFLGWRADLPAIYSDADVVALSSWNEGTPVSLIEALAAGRAVAATSVGGVPDLIGASARGLLVRPGSEEDLASAIIRLLDSPALRVALGRAGREHVYPEHDVSSLVSRIDALYRALLRRPSR